MSSAWNPSAASIKAEAMACGKLDPLPCDTETEREFGRMATATGIPMRSSPVTLPSRVTPIRDADGLIRASVSDGATIL